MRGRVRSFVLYWAPCLGWMGLIWWLSSHSSFEGAGWITKIWGYDKLIHALLYGGLGGTLFRLAAHLYPEVSIQHLILLTVLGTVAFGVTDELHQAFVPHRQPDFWDLLADAGGALLATSVLGVRYERRRERVRRLGLRSGVLASSARG